MSDLTAVFAVEVSDRPGMLNAVASVFADRGLSIESLVAETGRKPSRILVVFRGTARQCRQVEQVLPRLHHVHRVQRLPIDAASLHAIALCRLQGDAPELPGVKSQPLGEHLLLSGSYGAVGDAVEQLRSSGQLLEFSRSLVAL